MQRTVEGIGLASSMRTVCGTAFSGLAMGVTAGLVILVAGGSTAQAQPWPGRERPLKTIIVPQPLAAALQPGDELRLEESLHKARANGKYRTLLRQLESPDDAQLYGAFKDFGMFEGTTWRNFTDLPKGHWVYVQPYWYIWRDLVAEPLPQRSWGPEQLIGKPNTDTMGDMGTAWASRTQDEQPEWIMLEYDQAVVPAGVQILETYNPGAVNRVTAFTLDGKEVELWNGKDPAKGATDVVTLNLHFKASFKTNRIKVYLDSPSVSGWNEIDAVGLVDTGGKTHWATDASASTTFAQQDVDKAVDNQVIPNDIVIDRIDAVNPPQNDAERIKRLEEEVARLKAELAKLKAQLNNRQLEEEIVKERRL